MASARIHRHLVTQIQSVTSTQGRLRDIRLSSTDVAVARLELSAGRTMAGRNRGSGGGEVRKWVVIVGVVQLRLLCNKELFEIALYLQASKDATWSS